MNRYTYTHTHKIAKTFPCGKLRTTADKPYSNMIRFHFRKKKKNQKFFEFISQKNSGEKVKKGCGRIKLQENVIGTRVEEGNKDYMRLAGGNSAMNGEIVKR